MAVVISRAVLPKDGMTLLALRGECPPVPQTCTRQRPHECGVNGPCNGYPRTLPPPPRVPRFDAPTPRALVGSVLVGLLIAALYLGAVWSVCRR